jgi:hypothetical protein
MTNLLPLDAAAEFPTAALPLELVLAAMDCSVFLDR